jgi:hypothetical protein
MSGAIPDMLPKLEAWCAAMREMDKQYDALYALLGCKPEWPLTRAIQELQAVATHATESAVGDCGGWLSYYWLECNMGKGMCSGRHGRATIGDKEYRIRTLKQLARVIVADNRQEAVES